MDNYTPPTEAEIAEYELKMNNHYDKTLPFLRKKAEFDMLQADVAEARIRTLVANNQFAQAMAEQAKMSADVIKKPAETENKSAE